METRVIVNGLISRGVDEAMLEGGDLVLVLTDGKRISLGKVVPEKGVDYFDGISVVRGEVNADGDLIMYLDDGTEHNAGHVMGELDPEDAARIDDAVRVAGNAASDADRAMKSSGNAETAAGNAVSMARQAQSVSAAARADAANAVTQAASAKAVASAAAATASDAKTAVDAKLDKSGGTMTGDIAMGSNRITGLGAPVSGTDAATKAYVDEHGGGGGGLTPEQEARLQNAVCFGDVYDEAQKAAIQSMIGIYSSEGVGF